MVLDVHNTGEPTPPEVLPHLFDPFRRGRAGESPDSGNSGGLGLSIVEQIVKGHGGRIEVTSSAADGTRFRVTLPREPTWA
ncbi:HAMP domain-containing histidine kinase [Myxococcus stipitatus]|uniref:HAMP domain-containing sensor histidine kinase n=1 Tax=Myxococcus stipitatus TaxID=83455 RepID=UPI0031451CB8